MVGTWEPQPHQEDFAVVVLARGKDDWGWGMGDEDGEVKRRGRRATGRDALQVAQVAFLHILTRCRRFSGYVI
jgi:hypothetical protein